MGEPDFTSKAFYRFLDEHRLMGARCRSCGSLHVPPRPLCPDCHGDELAWEELGGDGTLEGFTVVYIAPTAMLEVGYGRDNPYCAAVVRLAEGPSISAQLVDVDARQPEGIEVGMRVQVAFLDRGEGENRRTALGFRR